MSLWAKAQQLPAETIQQIRAIYGDHFPIEVRHFLAPWIEEKFWSDIDPIPDNPQHEQYVATLVTSLINEMELKAASLVARSENHDKETIANHVNIIQQPNNAQIVITSLLAGAFAGALAKTTIAPLDRTKINFQISNNRYTAKKAVLFLKETFHREGLLALWRGNSATMARIVPYAAIQFTAHEQWKRILHTDAKDAAPALRFLAGSLAGLTSQSLTYPLDLARARMAVTHKDEYSTLRQVFSKIWKEEGILTFYRGYIPTLLGVIPYAGVSFFTYDTLQSVYKEKFDNKNLIPKPIVNLAFGAVSGMLGQSSSYPLDIVRRRMQTCRGDVQDYKTILGTLKKIYCEEGIKRGFFKGLSMNWVKGPIAVGISFATYDWIKGSLRKLISISS